MIINLSLEGGGYRDSNDTDLREPFFEPSTRAGAAEALIQSRDEYLDINYTHAEGHDLMSLSLHDLFEIAELYGVLIVVGAGNSAMPGDFNSVCYHAVTFCVGAITRRDNRSLAPSNLSNYGFMVQVSAPGVFIYTARFDAESPNSYGWVGGTSIATPMVAGLAGLILSQHRDLGPADLRKIIIASARPLTPNAGHATGTYRPGANIDAEVAAWRRAFLRLLGRDENLLLDGPAMQVLVNLIPHADNTVWLQSQTPRSAGTICAALDWDRQTQLAAMESDDCAKYVGPVIDAARAMAFAQSGEWRSMFADFDQPELEAARNIDPAALVALAQELGAVQ